MHAVFTLPRTLPVSRRLRSFAALTGLAAAVLLQGCNGGGSSNSLPIIPPPAAVTPPAPPPAAPAPDAATVDANLQATWVEIGGNNAAIARAITSYTAPADATTADANAVCPQLTVDGNTTRMTLRIGAGTMALRTTASDPVDSKPSAFPVSTCETTLPAGAKQAAVGSRVLPLPKAEPQRVLVLADTGCRMKKADRTFQPCNDSTVWPFAPIAATGAGFNPDLVMHIGDYHYRENVCPSDNAGCKDSPWGYGWDTWQADFFTPAAPLLAKAPWVLVRGNHEECARAGQGWARFLDPRPYADERSCNDPANDYSGNYTDPYVVALGAASQVIVFDSAKAGKVALKTDDPQFIAYQKQFQAVTALAAKPGMTTTMFTNHHPILAFAPTATADPLPGNLALQSVMKSVNATAYYPAGVHMALHGHVHDFQALNFSTDHPATIVTGNGGDNLDFSLSDPLPAGATPAPGVTVDRIAHHSTFGFMLMERKAAPGVGWNFKAYTVAGKLLATCAQTGRSLACDKTGPLTP